MCVLQETSPEAGLEHSPANTSMTILHATNTEPEAKHSKSIESKNKKEHTANVFEKLSEGDVGYCSGAKY
jgi:hypothetical protein